MGRKSEGFTGAGQDFQLRAFHVDLQEGNAALEVRIEIPVKGRRRHRHAVIVVGDPVGKTGGFGCAESDRTDVVANRLPLNDTRLITMV